MVRILSLTLRDAQHLSWKTFKKFEALDEKSSEGLGSVVGLLKKTEEIKNNIKALEKPESSGDKEHLAKSLSELMFIMFVLAERNCVSLEDSFLQNVDELILGFVS